MKPSTRKLEEEVRRAGLAIPPSERAAQIREDLLSQVEALRAMAMNSTVEAEGEARAESAVVPLRCRRVTWPRAVAAAMIVLAVLVSMGVASTYAMPGNPLYSVKRFLENVHSAFTPGGESEAGVSLSHAEKRLKELKYAGEREMNGWYVGLAHDAIADIRSALRESAGLPEEKAGEVRSSALALLERLLLQLRDLALQMPAEGAKSLRHELDETFQELGEAVPPPWEMGLEWEEGGKPREDVPPVPPPQPPVETPKPPSTPGVSPFPSPRTDLGSDLLPALVSGR
ncbi:DUF5667 domain-containing protein [Candidatus Solincola sp.]|jgi:hypothetical protein|nr:DUF5667 domain-containing protein [Actinomycetota bacterium]MDI7252326.1 DUF5667 domain-containing protein [Actinomycetota bacterium]